MTDSIIVDCAMRGNIAIFDPQQHVVGLKLLFPEADYYSISPSSFYKYNQREKEDFYKVYNFNYMDDLTNINSTNYDTLIIVFVLYDGANITELNKQNGANQMLGVLRDLVSKNKFKKVLFFDNYDYDYDPPSLFGKELPITAYFKRNYSSDVKYSPNVYSFPFMIFGLPICILWYSLINVKPYDYSEKFPAIFWSGGIYKHTDPKYPTAFTDRETIFNEIKSYLTVESGYSFDTFMKRMSMFSYSLDLNGVGNPNRRIFEILISGSLMLTHKNKLIWPFEEKFDANTFFETKEEFETNLYYLVKNKDNYNAALKQQEKILLKYLNKDWLRSYIMSKLV